jgi:copper homeostasis protein CutC
MKIKWHVKDYPNATKALKMMDKITVRKISELAAGIPLAVLYHLAYDMTKDESFLEKKKQLEKFYDAEVIE